MRHLPRLLPALAPTFLAFSLLTACGPELALELTTTELVNAARGDAGRSEVRPDARLVDIARLRSRDMAARGYFSHRPPDGCDYACLMDRGGIPHGYAGETIAWTSGGWSTAAAAAVESWLTSGPHTEQLLKCQYERLGAGAAMAPDGRIYITVIFEGNAGC